MTLFELQSGFSFEGVHRSNAVVNFSEQDPIDPKALWLNSQHLRTVPVESLAAVGEGDRSRRMASLRSATISFSRRWSIPFARAFPRFSILQPRGALISATILKSISKR